MNTRRYVELDGGIDDERHGRNQLAAEGTGILEFERDKAGKGNRGNAGGGESPNIRPGERERGRRLAALGTTDGDVRLDKVAALQQSIAAGTYRVSSSDVASKMVDGLLNGW